MRIFVLWGIVFFFSCYAYKDWFKSLCFLIALMSVYSHPDMPTNVFNIQGLNPWNVLLLNVFLSWLMARKKEGLNWDMAGHMNFFLMMYLFVIFIGFYRLILDRGDMSIYLDMVGAESPSNFSLFSEKIINSLKFILPALLIYDGCRTQKRQKTALFFLLFIYVALAIQVIRWVPPSYMTGGNAYASLKIIRGEIGLSRVNTSILLAGGSWGVLALSSLFYRKYRLFLPIAFIAMVYAIALTGGRTGQVAWAGVGLFLCALKWRKYFLFAPLVLMLVAWFLPGAVDRLTLGFGGDEVMGERGNEAYKITSGRTKVWPYVIEKIWEKPFLGYGRDAMQTTGLAIELIEEAFPHPHNLYLTILLESGIVGFLIIVPFYLLLMVKASLLFLNREVPLYTAVGGTTCAIVLAYLIAGMGSLDPYPREGSVGMWCAMALTLRLSREKSDFYEYIG